MIGQIIIAIMLLALAILILMIGVSTEEGVLFFVSSIIAGLIIGLIINFHDRIPKAIDVYRGKTTLKITYEDGIPVDSVVVFKK